MIITIQDDFDLEKIADSGQCFRMMKIDNERYRVVSGNSAAYIRKVGLRDYAFELTDPDHITFWKAYFGLDKNYSMIRQLVPQTDTFMQQAMAYGQGIRILKQDPWETLVSFIISQNKNIPAIKKSIEKLCELYGAKLTTPSEDLYLFPSPMDMKKATLEELNSCGLGYRSAYILDALMQVLTGGINLDLLNGLKDHEILESLKQIKGVGDKVAGCILLFGYGRLNAAPVDVWIKKGIKAHYNGINPFEGYGEYAGLMQQYMFYYLRDQSKFL